MMLSRPKPDFFTGGCPQLVASLKQKSALGLLSIIGFESQKGPKIAILTILAPTYVVKLLAPQYNQKETNIIKCTSLVRT